jgi:hypothetical protein
VLVYGTNIFIEQRRHLFLRQPDSIAFQPHLGSD